MTRTRQRQEQAVLTFGDGMEAQPEPRTNGKPEAAVLAEVLRALRNHPAVAWVQRQNTGAIKVDDRFVRFGWPGCADVLGQLRDGRFLAVECKSRTGTLRPEQRMFLTLVRQHGGCAFVARNLADVTKELRAFFQTRD